MLSRLGGGALLLLIVSWCLGEDKTPKLTDAQAFLGEWKITYFEEEGDVDPPEKFKVARYVFADGKLTIRVDGKVVVEGTYTLDPTQRPKHIYLKIDKETSGGIYELDGNKLTICAPAYQTKTPRPTEFKAGKKSGLMLLKLERVSK